MVFSVVNMAGNTKLQTQARRKKGGSDLAWMIVFHQKQNRMICFDGDASPMISQRENLWACGTNNCHFSVHCKKTEMWTCLSTTVQNCPLTVSQTHFIPVFLEELILPQVTTFVLSACCFHNFHLSSQLKGSSDRQCKLEIHQAQNLNQGVSPQAQVLDQGDKEHGNFAVMSALFPQRTT